MLTLEKSIGLFVPSTEDTDRPISSSKLDKRVEFVAGKLSDLFGGYSAFYSVTGGYRASNGQLISENSVLVVAFCTEDGYNDHYSRVLIIASVLAYQWSQETIAVLDCFQKMKLVSAVDYINDATKSICDYPTWLEISGRSDSPNARGFYDTGYSISLASYEEETKKLAVV